MSDFYVFGVSGKARHGKDTLAGMLRDEAGEVGINLLILPFALPLKARVYGRVTTATIADVMVHKPEPVRLALQYEGTEGGRDIYGADFWVRQSAFYINHLRAVAPFIHGVIIPDARFPNEVAYIEESGACIRVVSDRPTLTGKAAEHPSETSLDDFPLSGYRYIAENWRETTLAELARQAQAILHAAGVRSRAEDGR
jgi:hypothetical protein